MDSRKPAAIIVYSPDTGENETAEWYLYPPIWDEDYYDEIDVDASGWTADMDRNPIDGPFTSSHAAEAALGELE